MDVHGKKLGRYFTHQGRRIHSLRSLMPLNNYGLSERLGWLVDRFGVSWHLNLAA
jgi:predicted 3-demethylubiquinone-9 3-methyltransferase (glyoxalase superfamily)